MAIRQALRGVAQLVLTEQPRRPGKPDLDSQINEQTFHPERAPEAVVDELSVASE